MQKANLHQTPDTAPPWTEGTEGSLEQCEQRRGHGEVGKSDGTHTALSGVWGHLYGCPQHGRKRIGEVGAREWYD